MFSISKYYLFNSLHYSKYFSQIRKNKKNNISKNIKEVTLVKSEYI